VQGKWFFFVDSAYNTIWNSWSKKLCKTLIFPQDLMPEDESFPTIFVVLMRQTRFSYLSLHRAGFRWPTTCALYLECNHTQRTWLNHLCGTSASYCRYIFVFVMKEHTVCWTKYYLSEHGKCSLHGRQGESSTLKTCREEAGAWGRKRW
jgi:hypothetical protein